jgi:hypothetical protein
LPQDENFTCTLNLDLKSKDLYRGRMPAKARLPDSCVVIGYFETICRAPLVNLLFCGKRASLASDFYAPGGGRSYYAQIFKALLRGSSNCYARADWLALTS